MSDIITLDSWITSIDIAGYGADPLWFALAVGFAIAATKGTLFTTGKATDTIYILITNIVLLTATGIMITPQFISIMALTALAGIIWMYGEKA